VRNELLSSLHRERECWLRQRFGNYIGTELTPKKMFQDANPACRVRQPAPTVACKRNWPTAGSDRRLSQHYLREHFEGRLRQPTPTAGSDDGKRQILARSRLRKADSQDADPKSAGTAGSDSRLRRVAPRGDSDDGLRKVLANSRLLQRAFRMPASRRLRRLREPTSCDSRLRQRFAKRTGQELAPTDDLQAAYPKSAPTGGLRLAAPTSRPKQARRGKARQGETIETGRGEASETKRGRARRAKARRDEETRRGETWRGEAR